MEKQVAEKDVELFTDLMKKVWILGGICVLEAFFTGFLFRVTDTVTYTSIFSKFDFLVQIPLKIFEYAIALGFVYILIRASMYDLKYNGYPKYLSTFIVIEYIIYKLVEFFRLFGYNVVWLFFIVFVLFVIFSQIGGIMVFDGLMTTVYAIPELGLFLATVVGSYLIPIAAIVIIVQALMGIF